MAPARLLHAVPGRCRFRVLGLARDRALRERVERRLQHCDQVIGFRIAGACDSLVVEHRGPTATIAALLASHDDPTPALPPTKAIRAAPRPELALGASLAALALAALPGSAAFALLPLAAAGVPIWQRAWHTLSHERRLNVDFLDGLALFVSMLGRQPGTGAFMAALVHLGDLIREHTARRSQRQLHTLLGMRRVRARRRAEDGSIELVPADALRPGERVLVLAGDLLPADGIVEEGLAAIDQRHMTGEAMPATRRTGDTVYAGSVTLEGSLGLRVTAAGDECAAARIVQLVQAAPVGDTRMQNHAEAFADRLVAPLLGLNLALLAGTRDLDRFLSLAIVDYGTGIRVAAPTGVLATMTRAAREGIVIKSGGHLERLAQLRGVAFDKTGTLSSGRLAVAQIHCLVPGLGEQRLLQLAAAPEQQLRHPLARALVKAAQGRGLALAVCDQVDFSIGQGVSALVDGHRVQVGSQGWFARERIALQPARALLRAAERDGHSALLVALDGTLAGMIRCRDAPRPEARAVIAGLRRRGIRQIVMLTGDRAGVAHRLARELGVERVHAELLPADKVALMRSLHGGGAPFAMVGDGINDSPALAHADVGITLADGADIAREAADVVLMHDGLQRLLRAIDLSREALAGVRQNIAITAGLNTVALALALPGRLVSPALCTALSNGAAMVAAGNALRPLWAPRVLSLA